MRLILLLFFTFFAAHVSANETPQRMVFLGDSLTEGYGVKKENSYPAIIENQLKQQGYKINFTNASVSGSTTASLMSRLKWQLKNKPDIIMIALGANDGLRGFKIEVIEKNLSEAIELAQKNEIKILLAGMQMPPNYGKTYTKRFQQIFPKLAQKYKLELIPFLLEGVAGQKSMNQSDGIHPNEKGHKKMAETVLPYLKKIIAKKSPQALKKKNSTTGLYSKRASTLLNPTAFFYPQEKI